MAKAKHKDKDDENAGQQEQTGDAASDAPTTNPGQGFAGAARQRFGIDAQTLGFIAVSRSAGIPGTGGRMIPYPLTQGFEAVTLHDDLRKRCEGPGDWEPYAVVLQPHGVVELQHYDIPPAEPVKQ